MPQAAPAGSTPVPQIVIVGGGAGGLELATMLGNKLGRGRRAQITLVDRSPTHLWKPLLHEVAAGSMDINAHQLDYMAQARWHGFQFRLGAMIGLDRTARTVSLAPVVDDDAEQMLPPRTLAYDTLILALGSETNHFNTPGAAQYALMLDSAEQAERFHRKLIAACLRADAVQGEEPGEVRVVIIGAGATGVELAAELRRTTQLLAGYGLRHPHPERFVHIALVEAAPRILPALNERIGSATHELVEQLGIEILAAERVTAITRTEVRTASGRTLPADLIVWAAGIRAPECLASLDGLETNAINQLVVRATLQTTRDENVFAMGDCCACPWPGRQLNVPPRAQAAHQQAKLLASGMKSRLAGEPLPEFRYRDFGSLVSLAEGSAVGNLMGGLIGGSLLVEGFVARLMYVSLYRMHLAALHGIGRTALDILARFLRSRTEPRVKLH